ncbi:transcriptional regulator [Mycolicibacterium fortuitum]|uniref:Transcriptional regulator n=1 Tax=Mycolicibacterium fortuitum TaxID=1766 RepID=A0A378UUE3_MYCFO|nr:transcriptional regulator [Mycolicibacterium fortuitum]
MSPERTDWLVGGNRRAEAAERIYSAAAELAARDGLDALDIDVLAARVHCSRATIYRHAGGKAQIRDAVLARLAVSIVGEVRRAVDGLSGAERVLTAITVALQRIRCDPMFGLLLASLRGGGVMADLTQSSVPAAFATELTGLGRTIRQLRRGSCAWCCRCWSGRVPMKRPSRRCCDASLPRRSAKASSHIENRCGSCRYPPCGACGRLGGTACSSCRRTGTSRL